MTVETILIDLELMSKDSNTERQQRQIENLINRIKLFQRVGDSEKLESCRAKAELWMAGI